MGGKVMFLVVFGLVVISVDAKSDLPLQEDTVAVPIDDEDTVESSADVGGVLAGFLTGLDEEPYDILSAGSDDFFDDTIKDNATDCEVLRVLGIKCPGQSETTVQNTESLTTELVTTLSADNKFRKEQSAIGPVEITHTTESAGQFPAESNRITPTKKIDSARETSNYLTSSTTANQNNGYSNIVTTSSDAAAETSKDSNINYESDSFLSTFSVDVNTSTRTTSANPTAEPSNSGAVVTIGYEDFDPAIGRANAENVKHSAESVDSSTTGFTSASTTLKTSTVRATVDIGTDDFDTAQHNANRHDDLPTTEDNVASMSRFTSANTAVETSTTPEAVVDIGADEFHSAAANRSNVGAESDFRALLPKENVGFDIIAATKSATFAITSTESIIVAETEDKTAGYTPTGSSTAVRINARMKNPELSGVKTNSYYLEQYSTTQSATSSRLLTQQVKNISPTKNMGSRQSQSSVQYTNTKQTDVQQTSKSPEEPVTPTISTERPQTITTGNLMSSLNLHKTSSTNGFTMLDLLLTMTTKPPEAPSVKKSTPEETDVLLATTAFPTTILIICVVAALIVFIIIIVVVVILRARVKRSGKYKITSELNSVNGDESGTSNDAKVVKVQYNNTQA